MKAVSKRVRRPAPVGECCGRMFCTEEGWAAHLKRHKDEKKNAKQSV